MLQLREATPDKQHTGKYMRGELDTIATHAVLRMLCFRTCVVVRGMAGMLLAALHVASLHPYHANSCSPA